MSIIELVANSLDINQWTPVTGGLSTHKFKVGNYLYRIYNDIQRSLSERLALELLNEAQSEIKIPRFMEYLTVQGYHVNVVEWIEGESINPSINDLRGIWSLFPSVDGRTLPPHRKLLYNYICETLPIDEVPTGYVMDDWCKNIYIPVGNKLIHGDFHTGNILRTTDGRIALIDWEFSASGHPVFDFAYACCYYLASLDPQIFTKRIERVATKYTELEFKENIHIAIMVMVSWFIRRYRKGGGQKNLTLASKYIAWLSMFLS